MRKVLFTLKRKLPPEYKQERPFNQKGWFHGFFPDVFYDGDRNIECTYAFIESIETGIVHKLDTDDFRFLTEKELKEQTVVL